MSQVQVILFFTSGFFISRVLIKGKVPEMIVAKVLSQPNLSFTRLLLRLIFITIFLSFLIPNTITVLTLLPTMELLRIAFDKITTNEKNHIPTVLALSLIYGANIGGMGSVTATPANGIFVSYLIVEQVPGTEAITFASWLLWGIPLVVVFGFIAWGLLSFFFKTWHYTEVLSHKTMHTGNTKHPLQKKAIFYAVFYFVSSFLLSFFMITFPEYEISIFVFSVVITLGIIAFMFLIPVQYDTGEIKKPFLQITDCFTNLPTKGFLFVGISIAIAGILYIFNMQEHLAEWITVLIPDNLSLFLFFLILAILTSFATEVLSNTAVQIALFIVVVPLAAIMQFSPIAALLLITLSCTCAFMSPIATGVNGLAFGGIKNVSFAKMLLIGAVMNISGALLLSFWNLYITSLFYN